MSIDEQSKLTKTFNKVYMNEDLEKESTINTFNNFYFSP